MTGDVNVNVEASCLVMTTEILRNMLYRGHELVREVQWVIFDEVHYMRDKERGVIWEECIILLPKAVRFVFLSATVPNGAQFAAWVAATHGEPCHLITTPHRPTPLEHWVYPLGGGGLHMLVDDKGNFQDAAYDAACAALAAADARAAAAQMGSRSSHELVRLLRQLVGMGSTPAIVFSFSRKECEGAAICAKAVDTLPEEKREAVRLVFNAAIATLSSEDQAISQVRMLLPMLERGVAVHHSGMLPVLREVVEILFQEGLVQLLFATETFSMGVNSAPHGLAPPPPHTHTHTHARSPLIPLSLTAVPIVSFLLECSARPHGSLHIHAQVGRRDFSRALLLRVHSNVRPGGKARHRRARHGRADDDGGDGQRRDAWHDLGRGARPLFVVSTATQHAAALLCNGVARARDAHSPILLLLSASCSAARATTPAGGAACRGCGAAPAF